MQFRIITVRFLSLLRAAQFGGASVLMLSFGSSAQAQVNIFSGKNGGGSSNGATAAAQQAAQQAAAAAAQAAQRATDSLTRATQAIQSMRSAQTAAHNLAVKAPSSVPNGIGPGGLVPVANPNSTTDGLTDWIGANAPVQSSGANGAADVTIKQTQSSAILSWQSFNVGSNTALTFDQQGNASWIALNRVVDPHAQPSQILGTIKADGTVLVINQNGIVFGSGAQINVNSLIASTLDVGRAVDTTANKILSVAERDQEFLTYGLLGYADINGTNIGSTIPNSTFSTAPGLVTGTALSPVYHAAGSILVENGAQITSGDGGYILLTAPMIENAGHLSSTDGQVILAAGDRVTLVRATGAADSTVPGIRGFLAFPDNLVSSSPNSVVNDAMGLIESERGSIILGASTNGSAVNAGGLFSSTSVSRNGAVLVSGENITLAPGSTISITPDDDGKTIPQDPTSVADFKPSLVMIGNENTLLDLTPVASALVNIGSNTLTYAPGGDITIGMMPGASNAVATAATSRIFIDTGAVIDASGLKNVLIPALRNQITISPTTANDLADDPNYKGGFLEGVSVTVDPRLSGVRSDGVEWIGSPLIDATSYYQQVGVSAAELMTKGGNVTLGVSSFAGGTATNAPNVIVKSGAIVDISGGWVTYQAGQVRTTQLIDSSGRIVDIGNADPNDTYVGIYNGFTVNHEHWGIAETYVNPLNSGSYYQPQYTEGRDAGSLTLKGSAATFDGAIYAQAFPGPRQIDDAEEGTGTPAVYGDERLVQAAPSQLPAGGFLFVQGEALNVSQISGQLPRYTGGADIIVEASGDHRQLPTSFGYGDTLSTDQIGTIRLSDGLLSNSGFSQVSLYTSGAVTVDADATVNLNPGGVFDVLAGRKVAIEGSVSAPSGSISLATFDSRSISAGGSVFSSAAATVGDFDIVVDGALSTRGRWVNDFGVFDPTAQAGSAWLDGGSITLYAAPRVTNINSVTSGATPATSTDLSGSILINSGSLVDVSGGGRIDQNGKFDLTAHGGNLSLYDETSYFQIVDVGVYGSTPASVGGGFDGFRLNGLRYPVAGGTLPYVPINPDEINARVMIDPEAIKAQGFAGGGTFTLTTPEFAFGDDTSSDAGANATTLPLSFFSSAGFANYKITSYKTDLIANPFSNGLGGTDAILATQTLTIGNGQNLNLTQAMLPSILYASQSAALLNLASGGDIFSVLTPSVPTNAWDQRSANLTLGGLLELHVAQGGSITGAAGSSLTTSGLLNEGYIRLPGGAIVQQTILPELYAPAGTLAIHALSDVFGDPDHDGIFNESDASVVGGLTNAQLAGSRTIYLLGLLDANDGIELAPGSVTDLSGISIRNPYAIAGTRSITTGRVVAGGTIASLPGAALNGQTLFKQSIGSDYQALVVFNSGNNQGIISTSLDIVQAGRAMVLDSGSILNLSGASDTYDQLAIGASTMLSNQRYVPTPVWSDAGTLSASAGLTLTGATILAHGGAPQANGGTLIALDPLLAQHDPATPTANVISADMITASGFDTLVALGSVNNYGGGDATIALGRGFFVEDRPAVNGGSTTLLNGTDTPNPFVPTLRSSGGTLTINAPYVAFDSNFDEISTPAIGTAGANGSLVFNAEAIDITGILLADRSVGSATFNATGDIRLTGVVPWQQTFFPNATPVATLNGLIAANGNLAFNAGQLYPTTGSTFAITSSAANGTISFGRSGVTAPDAQYSAGGNLTVQAARIVQGGVIRVPLGTLALGGSTADGAFAPATQNVTLAAGGITSVSADGLVIPYGTTTDQTEWFFAPTGSDQLTAPPQKLLGLNGSNITIASGATVDLTGGGDVYAYEFVPGTGGSRDVLDRMNPDQFTSNNGYQYPDGRQVYAIVPGLSNNPVAAYDPIYSSDYGNLSSVGGAGSRVWLNGGNGLAAGWYTLLPAKYAMLPGGMRVVEETGATNVIAGLNAKQLDGTIITTGYYGNALAGTAQSQLRLFDVQSQSVIAKESQIAITTGNSYFTSLAAHNGTATPQLPTDAARLVINPGATLVVDTILSTAAAEGGRGAEVDIGGTNIDILSSLAGAPADGAVHLTASSLTNLNADSLFVGGARTDNSDGTTTLNVTTQNILVDNGASPLSAGEILLAATSSLTVDDGASITAVGMLSDTRTGAYQIGSSTTSGTGALLRIANGVERLVSRTNSTTSAALNVGAAMLSGNAVMFDSSGADSLDPTLKIVNAKFVAIGAPRIGFGADPSSYNGLVITNTLENLLSQSGAQLTLRSQSSIDFAGGSYDFRDIRFDAAALSDLDGGDVAINGNTISFGNAGAAGTVCDTCNAGAGKLAINAKQILFTGGAVAARASALATNVPVTLSQDTTFVLPAGTVIPGTAAFPTVSLAAPAQVVVRAGTALSIAGGTGLILPAGANTLSAGTNVTLGAAQVTLAAGSYYFPNGFTFAFSGGGIGSQAANTYTLGSSASVALPLGTTTTLTANVDLNNATFFGGGVTLSASNGVFAQGAGSVLDVGSAAFAIHTPYIGDQAVALAADINATIPDLTLATTGAVVVDNAGAGPVAAITGIPGSGITISGNTLSISGTTINATAGKVQLTSATGITLANGATIKAPGYVKVFGDSVDPVDQNAPGGSVTLAAQDGNILLGNAVLSVGGGSGDAGTLTLSAANGNVDFGTATLNGTGGASGAGGKFAINTLGTIDLVGLNTRVGARGFTSGFSVHTSTGDLVLAGGQSLVSGNINLTADGGFVDIAGTIDTSGINGGDIALYGRSGVTLTSTARLNAYATGYAADDTRQAKGGDVTLGTDFTSSSANADGSISGASGTISVANGALIDVSAKRPGDRLVPFVNNGTKYYSFVQGDEGGTVTLRAPVIGNTVNVSVDNAASIAGASAINLVGFKRWDLAKVASSGLYTGVSQSGNTVTLDVSAGLDTANSDGTLSTVTGLNFLGDKGDGTASTLVDFVQNFDISSSYGNLGGLANQSNFHAQPGMDLTYSGNITLASNWNLGAGVVDVDRALADGVMAIEPGLNRPYVVVGQEANLLANYTKLTYRVGGSVYGEPGVLSLRAGGNLDLKGSITDGFFQFRDQTDPTYLAQVGVTNTSAIFTGDAGCQAPFLCSSTDFAAIPDWNAFDWTSFTGMEAPIFFQGISFFDEGYTITGTAPTVQHAPFSALANTPAALGSFPMGTGAGTSSIPNGGDPIGSAEIFPLLAGNRAVTSWSYDLVAGADLGATNMRLSANPTLVNPSTSGSLIVEGTASYSYAHGNSGTIVVDGLAIATNASSTNFAIQPTDPSLPFAEWLSQFSTLYSGLSDDAVAGFFFGSAAFGDSPIVDLIYGSQDSPTPSPSSWLGQFIAANGLQFGQGTPNSTSGVYNGYRFGDLFGEGGNTTIYMPVYWVKQFYQQYVVPNASVLQSAFPCNVCDPGTPGNPVTAYTKSLVRTGTGSIDVAASGTVNLSSGPVVSRQAYAGGQLSSSTTPPQVGGTSIYTAGHPVDFTTEILTDPDTGSSITIDLSALVSATSNLNNLASYAYGAGTTRSSAPGVFVADPVALEGGGDITVTAGDDVLGRRDNYLSANIANISTTLSWVGGVDEPWRPGAVGSNTFAAINPQLFAEGIGALGGGDITVSAGRNISDISVIAADSLATAKATGGALPTSALATFGRGDVDIIAGNDIVGGRVDVASGTGSIIAGSDIAGAGFFNASQVGSPNSQLIPNLLKVRLTDATVSVVASDGLTIQGVVAMGSNQNGTATANFANNRNVAGLYSDRAALDLTADGSITVANNVSDNLGSNQGFVYPGTFEAASLTGDLTIATSNPVLLAPSPVGQLQLLAGGNIAPATIAMMDADPGLLPGPFSIFNLAGSNVILSGIPYAFPSIFPSTTDTQRAQLHNKAITHANDPEPVRIVAGNDIGAGDSGLIISVPKQARIDAGRDIIDMAFFGQNVSPDDITRVVSGRDIIATTALETPLLGWTNTTPSGRAITGDPLPALQGNTFVIGGPGTFTIEAGRDLGPFLNSAVVTSYGNTAIAPAPVETYGGGVMSVGNEWNPWLPAQGADVDVMFGVSKGINYDGFRDAYLDPAGLASLPSYLVTSANSGLQSIYASDLMAWLKQHAAAALKSAYGSQDVSYAQAYAVFKALPKLLQRAFLNKVYFNELNETADKNGPTYKQYARGYEAVNTLFPASLGYTANSLDGGANGANQTVETGNLDLRLATIETEWGGDIDIFGPGGRVIAGSSVRTDQQAARRSYDARRIYTGYIVPQGLSSVPAVAIQAIPSGEEGVLTLRGGAISTFTDGDFLLNQSRLFTEQGGPIIMWSSNADLNAGQGPKTSANFPPVVVKIDQNGFVETDQAGATTGAGIAALQTSPDSPPSNVSLIAPRGTVDAGAAGVRVSGNLSVAAQQILNTANFQVQGTTTGIPTIQVPNISGLTQASNTGSAAVKDVTTPNQAPPSEQPSIIIVEVIGYGGGDGSNEPAPDDKRRKSEERRSERQDPNSAYQVLGVGNLSKEETEALLDERRKRIAR